MRPQKCGNEGIRKPHTSANTGSPNISVAATTHVSVASSRQTWDSVYRPAFAWEWHYMIL